MSGIQITVEDTGKPELMEWARENGLEPERITMQDGCLPEIWDGFLTYGLIYKDEEGHDLVDQFHGRVFVVGRSKKVTPLPDGVGRPIDECEQLSAHTCPTCVAASAVEMVAV